MTPNLGVHGPWHRSGRQTDIRSVGYQNEDNSDNLKVVRASTCIKVVRLDENRVVGGGEEGGIIRSSRTQHNTRYVARGSMLSKCRRMTSEYRGGGCRLNLQTSSDEKSRWDFFCERKNENANERLRT